MLGQRGALPCQGPQPLNIVIIEWSSPAKHLGAKAPASTAFSSVAFRRAVAYAGSSPSTDFLHFLTIDRGIVSASEEVSTLVPHNCMIRLRERVEMSHIAISALKDAYFGDMVSIEFYGSCLTGEMFKTLLPGLTRPWGWTISTPWSFLPLSRRVRADSDMQS